MARTLVVVSLLFAVVAIGVADDGGLRWRGRLEVGAQYQEVSRTTVSIYVPLNVNKIRVKEIVVDATTGKESEREAEKEIKVGDKLDVLAVLEDGANRWVDSVGVEVLPGRLVVVTLGTSKSLPAGFWSSPASYSLTLKAGLADTIVAEISGLSSRNFSSASGLADGSKIGVGFMHSLQSGARSFAPSLFGRFPIKEDIYELFFRKFLGFPTQKALGLREALINVAFYVSGGLIESPGNGGQDSGVTGFGLGIDFYFFQGVRFTAGPFMRFEEGRGGITGLFTGLTLQIN